MAAMDGNLQRVLTALRNAQAVLAAYVEPEGPGAERTVSKLLGILDDKRLLAAQRAIDPEASVGTNDLRDDPPPQSR